MQAARSTCELQKLFMVIGVFAALGQACINARSGASCTCRTPARVARGGTAASVLADAGLDSDVENDEMSEDGLHSTPAATAAAFSRRAGADATKRQRIEEQIPDSLQDDLDNDEDCMVVSESQAPAPAPNNERAHGGAGAKGKAAAASATKGASKSRGQSKRR